MAMKESMIKFQIIKMQFQGRFWYCMATVARCRKRVRPMNEITRGLICDYQAQSAAAYKKARQLMEIEE